MLFLLTINSGLVFQLFYNFSKDFLKFLKHDPFIHQSKSNHHPPLNVSLKQFGIEAFHVDDG